MIDELALVRVRNSGSMITWVKCDRNMKQIVGPDFEDPRWDYTISPCVQSQWARPRRMRPITLRIVMDALTTVLVLVGIFSTAAFLVFGRFYGDIFEFLVSPWHLVVVVPISIHFFRSSVDSFREVDPPRKYKPGWKEPVETGRPPRAPMTTKLALDAFGRLLFLVFVLYVGGFLLMGNWFEEPLNYFSSPRTLIPLALIALWCYLNDVDAQRKLTPEKEDAQLEQ